MGTKEKKTDKKSLKRKLVPDHSSGSESLISSSEDEATTTTTTATSIKVAKRRKLNEDNASKTEAMCESDASIMEDAVNQTTQITISPNDQLIMIRGPVAVSSDYVFNNIILDT